MKKYSGVWPTMVTAFNEDGTLDIEGNKGIANKLIELGSDGLFAVCQSSEMFYLSLDEKVALARAVVEAADGRVPVIASGHTSDDITDQIKELRAIAKTGVEAVILVSNRLAKEDEGSQVFLKNLQILLDEVPDVQLGIYECPYPYKRLLTNEEIEWISKVNRIVFLKDVSCNLEIQKERVIIAKDSDLNLFNANTETLLDSLIMGYEGYNGVMGNFHIDIYKWLFENYKEQPQKARQIQDQLTQVSNIEKVAYPINAKYHLRSKGVDMGVLSRRMDASVFSKDQIKEVEELIKWEDKTRKDLSL